MPNSRSIFKYLLILFLTMFAGRSYCQYDSIAVAILDSMSTEVGDLESCSFNFSSKYDISNSVYGPITHSETGTMILKAPDKMYLEKKGDKGHKQFFYNGKTFLLYSSDKNRYASTPATISLIDFIDSISSTYGVEFPGADVFYPDFVDNILETSDNLIYLGLSNINGVQCYHVAGAREDLTFQFWITSDEQYLPLKMSIDYIENKENPRYSIIYTDWKLNEIVDDSKFEFVPPVGAQLVKLTR